MKAGQKLSYQGTQVALWPLPSSTITQKWGGGSHCCGNPLDVAIAGATRQTLYAPCDCYLYYEGLISNGHVCGFQSSNAVWCPTSSGARQKTTLSFQFTHGDLLGGSVVNGVRQWKQGEAIYTTGTYGIGSGDHVHIETSKSQKSPLMDYGYSCPYGNRCWAIQNPCPPNLAFWNNGSTINGASSFGLTFYTFNENGMEESGGNSGGGSTSNPSLKWVIPVIEGSEYTRSRYLTDAEMKNNFRCFYGEMTARGWSLNAICGMLGNIQSESQCSPNMWQGLYIYSQPTNTEGFGLVQWTPYTKIKAWMQEKGVWGKFEKYGTIQCERIEWECQNNAQWMATSSYPMSFQEFKKSTLSPSYLALVFLANYERPLDPYQPIRGTQAQNIYNYLKGFKPEIPDGAIIDGSFNPDEWGNGWGSEQKKKWKWIYYMKGKNK